MKQGSRSMRSRLGRRGAVLAMIGVGVVVSLAGAQVAIASPGSSSTIHFPSQSGWGTPTGHTTNLSNCPAPVINDFTFLDATGHGVSHQNTNPAQDFWATSTFTGHGTVTFYPASSLSFDDTGNVTGVTGPSDMKVS